MPEPWTVKYRPKRLEDIVGNRKAREEFLNWLQTRLKNKGGRKAALLYGPAGTGKTVTVEAAARSLNLDLVEINASDKRTSQVIERIAGLATTQSTLYGLKRLLLLDEVDGVNLQEDRGAVPSILKVIEDSAYPVVMTANDPWDPKIRPLREVSLLVRFRRLSARECVPFLRRICQLEGVKAEEEALRLIAERNQGDMRSIVNDLETLCVGRKVLRMEDVAWLAWRDRLKGVFEALQQLFHSRDVESARSLVDEVDVDYETFFEWIYENALHQLKDPGDVAEAMDRLARAQLLMARMKSRQLWSLLPYALELMTAGVALARKGGGGYTQLKFPERLKYLSATRKARTLLNEASRAVGRIAHVSSAKAAREYIPYLRFILKANREEGLRIAGEAGLTEEVLEGLTR
ncbi:MAG: replication factor C large subunit [Thermoproteota archaeon]